MREYYCFSKSVEKSFEFTLIYPPHSTSRFSGVVFNDCYILCERYDFSLLYVYFCARVSYPKIFERFINEQ